MNEAAEGCCSSEVVAVARDGVVSCASALAADFVGTTVAIALPKGVANLRRR